MNKNLRDHIDQIIKKYLEGKGSIILAKEYKTTPNTIRAVLRENDINIKEQSKSLVNFNPFQDLQNQEVNYWLGWLVTDGNLFDKRIELAITEKDKDVIYKYCNFLKLPEDYIKIYKSKNDNWEDKYSIRFGNKDVFEFLKVIGITEKKSKTVNPNFEITHDFIRGMIEGDGCIMSNKKCAIVFSTSSEKLKECYCKYLIDNNIKHSVSNIKDHFKISVVTKQSLKLVNLIYDNPVIFGERKYQKALTIKKQYEQ